MASAAINLPIVVVLPCCRFVIHTRFSHFCKLLAGPSINANSSGPGCATPLISDKWDAVSRFITSAFASNLIAAHGADPKCSISRKNRTTLPAGVSSPAKDVSRLRFTFPARPALRTSAVPPDAPGVVFSTSASRIVSVSISVRVVNMAAGRLPANSACSHKFIHVSLGRTAITTTMGWGLTAAIRADVLASSTSYETALPETTVYFIDGPAVCRSNAVGTRPASAIAQYVLNQIKGATTDVVILFDCPAHVPAARDAVHLARGVDATGAALGAEFLQAATTRTLGVDNNGAPITWQRLFNTTVGKARAYELLHLAFREETLQAGPKGRATTISSPTDASVWSHPFDQPSFFASDISNYAYGEAEAQLAMCVHGLSQRRPGATSTIWTIDTDILLQVALTPAIDASAVQIALAKVYKNDDTVVRSSAAGRKRAKIESLSPMWEIVSCRQLQLQASATGLFWFLCAGGVDYCRGLGGFGWPQRVAIHNAAGPKLLFQTDGGWKFDIERLASTLRDTRKSRRKDAEPGQLANELDNILFCWRYYMWQCKSKANVAGPAKTVFFSSFGAHTVTDWLETATGEFLLPDQSA